jgi:hypothetical protein
LFDASARHAGKKASNAGALTAQLVEQARGVVLRCTLPRCVRALTRLGSCRAACAR